MTVPSSAGGCHEGGGRETPGAFPRQRLHEGGILILVIYESKDACERFTAETLTPLMPIAGGLADPPQEPTAELTVLEALSRLLAAAAFLFRRCRAMVDTPRAILRSASGWSGRGSRGWQSAA